MKTTISPDRKIKQTLLVITTVTLSIVSTSASGEALKLSSQPVYVLSQNATPALSGQTVAAAPTNLSTYRIRNRQTEQTPLLRGSLGVSLNRTLVDQQDGKTQQSMSYELSVKTERLTNWSIGLKTGYNQDLKNSENNDMTATSLSAGYTNFKFGERWMAVPSAILVLPTSKDQSKRQQVNYSAGGSFTLVSPWFVSASVSLLRNVHRFETDVNGSPNSKYSSTQSISADIPWRSFSFSAGFFHRNGWTYGGTLKESFEHFQEVSWGFNKYASASLGHSNGGSVFKPDGQSSNIELINENSSTVYTTLTLSY